MLEDLDEGGGGLKLKFWFNNKIFAKSIKLLISKNQ